MDKTIKTIILSIAMTGLLAALPAHAGLTAFIRRCFTTSLTANDCAQGKMLKKLAEPYGLKCTYPVFVKPGVDAQAAAHSLLNDDTKHIYDKTIVFNAEWVDEQLKSGNEKHLIATLFHETAHLDLNHAAKKLNHLDEFIKQSHATTMKKYNDYVNDVASKEKDLAALKKNITAYGDTLIKSFEHATHKERFKITRAHEYEADASCAAYADLCFAVGAHYRSIPSLSQDVAELRKSFGKTMSKPMLASLYQKACKQNAEAYETLEKDSTHPLNGRRSAYLLDMALKAPIRKSLPLHYAQWAHARADLALMLHVANKLLRE